MALLHLAGHPGLGQHRLIHIPMESELTDSVTRLTLD
jgi:hypothetical protein